MTVAVWLSVVAGLPLSVHVLRSPVVTGALRAELDRVGDAHRLVQTTRAADARRRSRSAAD